MPGATYDETTREVLVHGNTFIGDINAQNYLLWYSHWLWTATEALARSLEASSLATNPANTNNLSQLGNRTQQPCTGDSQTPTLLLE